MIPPGFQPALLALQASGIGAMTPFIIQIAAIFAIFYFLLIRPQQKQKRQHEEALRAIKRGDQVVTAGGIIGEVVHVRETVNADGTTARPMEDQVTIKSAESRFIVERGRIAKIVGGTSATTKD
ncbi:MAG TPA: preprotein translocase subunit YajC [Gemmatimonadaceae bacterium]|jgi:preprotein translocase subunit YajC|nr:preprotein translocase subunit YajC [Gemmatimonadaceae bacterium]